MTPAEAPFPVLGRSLSRLVLGTAPFGVAVPEAEARDILDAYVQAGGNVLDTAAFYGAPAGQPGASEAVIGRWLKDRALAAQVVVVTKGGHPPPRQKVSRLNPPLLLEEIEGSLQRLGLPVLDVYLLHKDDENLPVEGLVDFLEALREAGKIRAYGVSNWRVPRLRAAWAYTRQRGYTGWATVQSGWSLAHRDSVEDAFNPHLEVDGAQRAFHRETGLALMAYGAQAQGFFAWKGDEANPGRTPLPRFDNDLSFRRQRAAKAMAQARGLPPTRLALAWLLHQPEQPFAIAGINRRERVSDTLAALDVDLAPADLESLEAGL